MLFARHGDCHPDDVVVVHSSTSNLVLQLCQCMTSFGHEAYLIGIVFMDGQLATFEVFQLLDRTRSRPTSLENVFSVLPMAMTFGEVC